MIVVFDFGATRIKSAVARSDSDELTDLRESEGGSRAFGSTVPPSYFASVFRRHLDEHAAATGGTPDAVWLASEMHGFLLVDPSGAATTPYVSWRADMGREHGSPHLSSEIVGEWGEAFLAITGMRPRVGLPATNLAALKRVGARTAGILVGIPEWLMIAEGRWSGASDLTLAAATGLIDLSARTWSPALCRDIDEAVLLPDVSDDVGRPIGTVVCRGREVPVHGGIGDLQAALAPLGLGRSTLSINIGTGSQVSQVIDGADRRGAELRPFVRGDVLRTQTHIAAGRSLACFSDLFDEIAAEAGGTSGVFWRIAAGLSADDIRSAPVAVDPAVFDSAWCFAGGGSLRGLLEGRMRLRDVVAGICQGWLGQYARAAAIVDPDRSTTSVLLSGGLPRRLPVVAPVLEEALGRPTRLASLDADETLHGLRVLASASARPARPATSERARCPT